ncbi:histidine phosphatase family protein [Rhodobacterales bacterium]|nr:histidine phosphatase family protein [Rhodobacterales bacterium]
MPWCLYLTHPEVSIDPSVPVPEWRLSEIGRERVLEAWQAGFAADVGSVVSSGERKAVETGEIFSEGYAVPLHVRPDLHENDRSATGFLPPDEFEKTADRFFAEPEASIDGWERAIDAQERMVAGISKMLNEVDDGEPVLFTGHGAVGTLLMCHLMRASISRSYDQKRGGSWYRFEKDWLHTRAGRNLGWTEL